MTDRPLPDIQGFDARPTLLLGDPIPESIEHAARLGNIMIHEFYKEKQSVSQKQKISTDVK